MYFISRMYLSINLHTRSCINSANNSEFPNYVSHHGFGVHNSMPATRPGSEGCRGPIAQQCGSQWNSQSAWVSEQDFLTVSRQFYEIGDRGDRNNLNSVSGPRVVFYCKVHSIAMILVATCPHMSLPPAIVCLSVLRLGFATAVRDVLSIKEDGLLAGGPPCGPWIWINAATHGRKTWSIFGDTTREYVAASNVSIWQYQSIFFFINLSLLFPVVSVQAARYKTLGGKPHWEWYGFDEVNTNGVCRVWPRRPKNGFEV